MLFLFLKSVNGENYIVYCKTLVKVCCLCKSSLLILLIVICNFESYILFLEPFHVCACQNPSSFFKFYVVTKIFDRILLCFSYILTLSFFHSFILSFFFYPFLSSLPPSLPSFFPTECDQKLQGQRLDWIFSDLLLHCVHVLNHPAWKMKCILCI